MEYEDYYEPKIIIGKELYDDYLLQLHREVSYNIAVNLDPPNPFRSNIEEGNIRILVNDTNDLHWALKYCERKIIEKEYEYVIIGDPNTIGYSSDVLENMCDDIKLETQIIKNKDWIICMININNRDNIIIKDNKIVIE